MIGKGSQIEAFFFIIRGLIGSWDKYKTSERRAVVEGSDHSPEFLLIINVLTR